MTTAVPRRKLLSLPNLRHCHFLLLRSMSVVTVDRMGLLTFQYRRYSTLRMEVFDSTSQDISTLTAGTYLRLSQTIMDVLRIGSCRNRTCNFILATTQVNVSCNGGSDSSIDLSVSGGTAPHIVGTTPQLQLLKTLVLPIGTYTATVTDDNGCTTVTTLLRNLPLAVSAAIRTLAVMVELMARLT